ncbi:hypothetical protein HK101_000369 [Irineochytrium annulatum]|nr:hypothetical protein HK101_000369 [Irineochytrium annulatum]
MLAVLAYTYWKKYKHSRTAETDPKKADKVPDDDDDRDVDEGYQEGDLLPHDLESSFSTTPSHSNTSSNRSTPVSTASGRRIPSSSAHRMRHALSASSSASDLPKFTNDPRLTVSTSASSSPASSVWNLSSLFPNPGAPRNLVSDDIPSAPRSTMAIDLDAGDLGGRSNTSPLVMKRMASDGQGEDAARDKERRRRLSSMDGNGSIHLDDGRGGSVSRMSGEWSAAERLIAERRTLPDGEEGEDDEVKAPKPRLTTWAMVKLNAFWFGYQVYWFLIAIVIVPKQIESIMGDEDKGKGLSFISLLAGVMNLFLAVFLGAFNDRSASRFGKRRPWMAAGAIMMCVSLLFMDGSMSLTQYLVGYLFMTFSTGFQVIASVPFNGLLADVTPNDQKGAVSSIMGFLNLSGYLLGAVIGMLVGSPATEPSPPTPLPAESSSNLTLTSSFVHQTSSNTSTNPLPLQTTLDTATLYSIMSLLVLSSALITITSTRERSSLHLRRTQKPIRWIPFLADMVRPLTSNSEFRLVFASRFLFQLGIATVQQFLQYWIGDCVQIDGMSSTRAVSIALVPLLLLSPIGALVVPMKRRKVVIYVATAFMIASCLLMLVVRGFGMALVVGGIFGLGYGPFISTEFAMLMDVLPNEEEAARDISLWHSALVLPQIVATPVAGWLLDEFQQIGKAKVPPAQCLGYQVVFALCIVYYLLGAEATRRLKTTIYKMYASAILLALASSVVAQYQYGDHPASSAAPVVTKPAYGGEKPASTAAPEKTIDYVVSTKAATVAKPDYVASSAAPAKTPEYVASSAAPEKTGPAYGAPSSTKAPTATTPAYSSRAPVVSTPSYVNSSKAPQVTTTPKYEPECDGEPTSTHAAVQTTPAYAPAYLASTKAPVNTNIAYSAGETTVVNFAAFAGAAAVAALFI